MEVLRELAEPDNNLLAQTSEKFRQMGNEVYVEAEAVKAKLVRISVVPFARRKS